MELLCVETLRFHKILTTGNYVKFRYFTQCPIYYLYFAVILKNIEISANTGTKCVKVCGADP